QNTAPGRIPIELPVPLGQKCDQAVTQAIPQGEDPRKDGRLWPTASRAARSRFKRIAQVPPVCTGPLIKTTATGSRLVVRPFRLEQTVGAAGRDAVQTMKVELRRKTLEQPAVSFDDKLRADSNSSGPRPICRGPWTEFGRA
ncbi:MAG: hypothetical protein ACI8QS_003466, partial [Planctomycetota bacterium]